MSDATPVNHELKKPFLYTYKGEKVEASFISLEPPTFKQLEYTTPMKQAITSAIVELTEGLPEGSEKDESDKDEADEGPTAKLILAALYQWSGNLNSVFVNAQELFKNGGALVEGESKLTKPLMEEMSPEDFEQMVGKYIATFLAASLMAGE